MARLVLCVLALLAAGGLADPIWKPKVADPVLLQRQLDLIDLFSHLHEPSLGHKHSHVDSYKTILTTWTFEKNIEHFANVSAVTTLIEMLDHKWILPKAVPFNVHEPEHKFEAVTVFHVLYSAKDYDTFYKSAVYLREHINEHLYSYVLTVVIYNRKDTQGIFVPHIWEVFPSYFFNGNILTTAQRIGVHGHHNIDFYPSTYKWNDNVVIKWNVTTWPYDWAFNDGPVVYFTHDNELNAAYYNLHVANPGWLGGEIVPLVKDRRGEWWWFYHKQLLTRYYMERLSNGLGEIPVLEQDFVKHGYSSGLLYHNGIPFPSRPNNYHLDQPEFVQAITALEDYEHRIREAIEQGYVVNHLGEHISLLVPEAIDVLGRVIEANVDSPNWHYYKDFITIWKQLLGNSQTVSHQHQYYNGFAPLVVPSVLEHYQTALRDPAFYMIWKRVLGLFQLWQESLPHYKREELALPQVAIQKVEVDKLVTYFEHSYVNVTNHLWTHMGEGVHEKVSVLVQWPRLNHKVFKVRVNVKSEVAKTVVVRFFLAPKYDSHGNEIPLHVNSQNFYLVDEFLHDLPVGESVITRASDENVNAFKEWDTTSKVYENVQKALHGQGKFVVDQIENVLKFPQRLVLPKGRVGGMPFVMMVYISEYRAPVVPLGTGFDPTMSLGLGSGGRYLTDEPLGFPVNRPIHAWQVEGLHNLHLQDVMIHHKHTPEIVVPYTE